MKGEIIIFSIIWDGKLRKYKVKRTAILSLEEIMSVYAHYNTQQDALKAVRGLNKRVNNTETKPKP